MLAHAGLQHESHRQRPHRLRGLREAAPERAQQIEDLLVGDAGRAKDLGHAHRLEVALGVDGLVRVGDRQAHRAADGDQEVELRPGLLGDLASRVAGAPADHALGGQEHQRAGARGALQIAERYSVGGEVPKQRLPLGALLALQAIEQALGDEVDLGPFGGGGLGLLGH